MDKFQSHLKKQLSFLERSCAAYDQGCNDEAIRIATVIRVIIHNTKSSTSLLKHLNATTINLLTSVNPVISESDPIFMLGMGKLINGQYLPKLELASGELIPVSKWWSQTVMKNGNIISLTRKNIVLTAANKDGGAHVDAKLTPAYEELAKDGAMGTSVQYNPLTGYKVEPDTDAHLLSLRQMGFELLNSEELNALL